MNEKIKIVNKRKIGLGIGANVLMLAGAVVLAAHGLLKFVEVCTKINEYNEKYDPDSCEWLKKNENNTEEPVEETTE